jgi:hypothetical protein
VIEKPAAVPEVSAIIASLEPVASLTTVALTPRLDPLMAVARSFNVSPDVPVPVAKVAEGPAVVVSVRDDVGKVAVGLDSRSEYHDAVVATLFTTTVWVPETVPVAAVAARSLLSEDVTVLAARGPVNELRFCISVARASVAVWIEVKAVVWLERVVWSACHARSGARSA